ncbi:MAG: T9SS type A sorting domain-containing protein [Paludibacter sp.]
MKKLFTLMLGITTFIGITNATVYYVNSTGGSSSAIGTSWATAVRTIDQAATLAATNPGTDDVYVKGGTLTFPGSTLTIPATNDLNVYGSFQGIDGETPATRPIIDVDGNGIIEPWEFLYPTNIVSGNANNAVVLAASIFDGFTITHIGTKTTGIMSSVVGIAGSIFQNNIVKNSVVNITITSDSNFDGILVRAVGLFKNCLFEKNTVTSLISTTVDKYFCPGMSMAGGSKVTGCVFRNNKAIIDCTTSAAGTTGSVKGTLINIYGGVTGTSVLSNCLIYNNETVYTAGGGTATPIMTSGCIVGTAGLSSVILTDSIINCTIANNKMHNSAKGGVFIYNNNMLVNNVLNNALWNNKVDSLGLKTIVKNLYINSAVSTGRIGYNVMNKGNTGGFTSNAFTANNVLDLTFANVSTPDSVTAPRFKIPSTSVGCNRVADSADSIAIAHADWRIDANSYLIGKGKVTTVLTDKAGNPFATAPVVGAYEYVSNTALFPVNQNVSTLAYSNNGKVISKQEGKLQIFNLTGSVVWAGNVVSEQKIALPSGCYLLRLASGKDISTQKIVL